MLPDRILTRNNNRSAYSDDSTVSPSAGQVYELTDEDFACIRQLVLENTGINLSPNKRHFVYGRLRKRLKALGLNRFHDYCHLVASKNSGEIEHFTNAITTNLTCFFREEYHFEYIAQQLLPAMMETYQRNKRLRILSAGCSTGEEPYSLAITLREAIDNIDCMDIRILATDLDSSAVQTAARGVYAAESADGLDAERMHRWFLRGKGCQQGMVKVSPELRRLVTFKQLNLMHPWPMRGLFDIIFCRNVVIYFDKSKQSVLFDRFANIMRPGAHLFIGPTENLNNISSRFRLLGKSIYQRVR